MTLACNVTEKNEMLNTKNSNKIDLEDENSEPIIKYY